MTADERRDADVHGRLDETARERVALHALGALEAPEAADFERHAADCAACRDEAESLARVAADLALLAPAATPPEELGRRLLARASGELRGEPRAQPWKSWSASATAEDLHFVPRGGEAWERTSSQGVEARRLFVDPAGRRITMLVRMAPGSSYPAHVHGGPEECYVISGDLHVGDGLHMKAGDYQRAAAGVVHPVQSTETGCLLFIVSSLDDELLAAR